MAAARSKGAGGGGPDILNSNKTKDLEKRIFVGNLPTFQMTPDELEDMFSKYGKIVAHNMLRGYGFVQFEQREDAQAAVAGEDGRLLKGHKLDVNMAAERRNSNKAPAKSSPPRRAPNVYGDAGRDRSPLRLSPRRNRDSRTGREVRDLQELRELRDSRDLMVARDLRDLRNAQDLRNPAGLRNPLDMRDRPQDLRDPLFDRFRDPRDIQDPLFRRDEAYERLMRYEELYRRKEDPFLDRYRDQNLSAEERLKREERRREELYRKYFEDIQRRFEAERPVDCSVVVVGNKQANPGVREYAEAVGRKVRDLGMVVDLIFLNTEASLTQALEDVSRAGSPFAIVITLQHQMHRSCTVNILFGTPQEHRNMPLADAVVLVARNYERCKLELRDKEREEIARQAAKMADEIILQERERDRPSVLPDTRVSHPPAIQTLLSVLAENRYLGADELDKVINYLIERKEKIRAASEPSQSQASRQAAGATSVRPLENQPGLAGTQSLQSSQPMSQPMSQAMAQAMSQVMANPPPINQPSANPQQELQAKILSLFNSGSGPAAAKGAANSATSSPVSADNQNYGLNNQARPGPLNASSLNQPQQRNQAPNSQMGQGGIPRSTGPRPGGPSPLQNQFGQLPNRLPASSNVQQPSASAGINFDNPSVQKALDTLIQSGPALSHLVSQTTAQTGRAGGPMGQQPGGMYQRY